ncbi:hypothetical protein [Daejeonella lutea]|uniref:DoxX protein n=1 Tax=Daejeonella lutea TaxID=572036 RepID=A0A1T5APX3_9SPHI|nr:hypothetical protein [Daejeonella lutea]SKB36877.1 hypothetical protein SAMN05661099_0926 [Daejeonella lutea]
MTESKLKDFIELICRLYVFTFLNLYAIGKIMGGQFYTPERLPAEIAAIPLGKVESFDLAWTFMGHSYTYILFIGLSQLMGAWMLLSGKLKLIGVFILLPIMVNIIVFDIIFLDTYGALASALIYFSMLIVILLINKDKIIGILRSITDFPPAEKATLNARLMKIAFVLVFMAAIFVVDQLIVNLIGHGKG